jgi:tRNA(fMet)-specific endonuclease VapC
VRYLLDTSTCIAHLRGGSPNLSDRLAGKGAESVLCSIVLSELLFGVERSASPAAERAKCKAFTSSFDSLPFDDDAASKAAQIRARLASAGTPVGPYDLLIAATAVSRGLIVVTCNVVEFERVSGLEVQNWNRAEDK